MFFARPASTLFPLPILPGPMQFHFLLVCLTGHRLYLTLFQSPLVDVPIFLECRLVGDDDATPSRKLEHKSSLWIVSSCSSFICPIGPAGVNYHPGKAPAISKCIPGPKTLKGNHVPTGHPQIHLAINRMRRGNEREIDSLHVCFRFNGMGTTCSSAAKLPVASTFLSLSRRPSRDLCPCTSISHALRFRGTKKQHK
jgi:hypothetical protein